MIADIEQLLEQYHAWLKSRTHLRSLDGAVEITTPFLDRHNDYLQIYAVCEEGGFLLSDDGYILDDLALSGCSFDNPKRTKLLKMTLNGFGILLNERTNALEIKATRENFALKKHNILQAMLAVNDLFYVASPSTANFFHEDVADWLDDSDVRYTPGVKFTGKSGFDYQFDFVIPKSKAQPERIVRVINRPNKDSAQRLVFAWLDTKETRSAESTAFAVLNDTRKPVSGNVIDAMRCYDINCVSWSDRNKVQEHLAT